MVVVRRGRRGRDGGAIAVACGKLPGGCARRGKFGGGSGYAAMGMVLHVLRPMSCAHVPFSFLCTMRHGATRASKQRSMGSDLEAGEVHSKQAAHGDEVIRDGVQLIPKG